MLPTTTRKSSNGAPGVFRRAAERFSDRQSRSRQRTRIGFVIDATGSRAESWEKAQVIQAQMFRAAAKLGPLSLRLVHFGGNQVTDKGWTESPRELAATMARVRCESGHTQILDALCKFLKAPEAERADAIILIGDSYEEDPKLAEWVARCLKGVGIRVFCFHEGEDWTAESVFRHIARITGGRFARFGSDLPLADLCEGVTLLAAGGADAVKRLGNKRVRQLLLPGPSGK